jgi:starch synthase
VRKTGGLNDTVQNYNPATGEGTGFVFEHFTSSGLLWGMQSAIATFYNKGAWHGLMRNAMSRNFSWDVQVLKYIQLYHYLVSG